MGATPAVLLWGKIYNLTILRPSSGEKETRRCCNATYLQLIYNKTVSAVSNSLACLLTTTSQQQRIAY